MHIPDSAISPATSLAAGAAMLPVWAAAGRRLRATLDTRRIPLLSIGAAFCFAVMMFNIPVPGGTTVHPVGGALLAVLLGPWAAVIGVTVALVIQALFFGDGGVFALGANCFTMAFAMPMVGWLVYRLAAGRSPADSRRKAVAAGVGAYAGLNAAALLTALLLGLQPALFHDPAGRALYFPFGLRVTVPALMAAHLLVAGPAEAAVTALAVRYLQRAGIPLYGADAAGREAGGRLELLWAALAGLAALSPLGLLAKGDAWGEWGATDIASRAGYVPTGIAGAEARAWHGFNLLPDYLSDRGRLAYALAAAAGILLIAAASYALARLLARRAGPAPHPAPAPTVAPGELPRWMTDDGRRTTAIADCGLRIADCSTAPNTEYRTRNTAARHPSSVIRHPSPFIERTLSGLAAAARETVFGERWAGANGLLQRLDARAKVVAVLALVVAASCVHSVGPLLALYAVCLALAALSRVPRGVLVRRVWLAVPLFVGAVTLPAALNVVTPGRALLVLHRDPYLAVTAPGLAVAALLTLRVGVAMSFAALLPLTTRWNDLLVGLRALAAPRLFVTALAMTYRYLGVLTQSAEEMFTARRSRTVGHASRAEDRRFLGDAIGALFGKTVVLTDEVHAAMLSRGWTGEARALSARRLDRGDVAWLAAMLLLAALAVGGGRIG